MIKNKDYKKALEIVKNYEIQRRNYTDNGIKLFLELYGYKEDEKEIFIECGKKLRISKDGNVLEIRAYIESEEWLWNK